MKVYFTSSARGTDLHKDSYKKIYDILKRHGWSHLDEVIMTVDSEVLYKSGHDDRVALYKKTIDNIKHADLVVLEVSIHSFSMGYVLQKALELGRPVIALYTKGYDPFFARGIDNEKLQVLEYNQDDLDEVLAYALDYASDQQDTRFNFFISPKHQNYLDWVAKERKIPRSVHLRNLIEADMDKNTSYGQ